jgi:hypothetical protein
MAERERIMVFVDGTNFLIQLSAFLRLDFRAEKPPWPAIGLADRLIHEYTYMGKFNLIRRYWFASYKGNEEFLMEYREQLRSRNFEPKLFRKRGDREKGVDIALTKEMLVNAFQNNCDWVVLIADDEDYVELVEEVKRYGQKINGLFFQEGLSKHLRLAFDDFAYVHQIGFGPGYEPLKNAIADIVQPNK